MTSEDSYSVTLAAQRLSLGYHGRTVVEDVSTDLPAGRITATSWKKGSEA